MHEEEWGKTADLSKMMNFLCGPRATLRRVAQVNEDGLAVQDWRCCKTSERKLRLFGCACCRRIWQLLNDLDGRAIVESLEEGGDAPTLRRRLQDARERQAREPELPRREGDGAASVLWWLTSTADRFAEHTAEFTVEGALAAPTPQGGVVPPRTVLRVSKEWQQVCDLLRDITNPFHSAKLDPTYRSDTVMRLAAASYEERALPSGHLDPTRLAVLADGLEEAGSSDAELLAHLRGPGPHVVGCWAVDILLEKS